jgi:hypothetical protein
LDVAVVADVVAAVGQRGGVPGVGPEGVDTDVGQVVQAGAEAGDVAGSVAVGEATYLTCSLA